jgi:histidine ammonia-lyase
VPYIPSQGSVGTSGDIVPLAHLAAFIIGEGFVFDENGKVRRSKTMLKKNNIKPHKLGAKEGLALITGTHMMTSYAVDIVNRASKLSKLADIAGALTMEALGGSPGAFENELQMSRPHKGQIKSASNLRKLLKNSEIISQAQKTALRKSVFAPLHATGSRCS